MLREYNNNSNLDKDQIARLAMEFRLREGKRKYPGNPVSVICPLFSEA
jgi:hypothetical protein